MAQADYFLKIEGIDGESSDDKHKGWIDIQSFSWGAANSADTGGTGGSGAGKVRMRDVVCTAAVSKASPKLMEACATGQHLKGSQFEFRKAGGDQMVFLTIKLSDLIVSSYDLAGSGGQSAAAARLATPGAAGTPGIVPTDQFSLNFSKIEVEYKEQKPDGTLGGSVKAGYDVKANKKV